MPSHWTRRRKPRERARNRTQGHVTDDVQLNDLPAEVEDRAVPGHWEGDLIIGLHRSTTGTVVERTSRDRPLAHMPRLEDYGVKAPVKNGPALGGCGAIAMKDALESTMGFMPAGLLRALTWDRGKELFAHAQFTIDTGIKVLFADPHSPWQRATNENPDGPLRQYSPKGAERSGGGLEDLLAVQDALNGRPRVPLLEHPRRSPRRASTVAPARRRCND